MKFAYMGKWVDSAISGGRCSKRLNKEEGYLATAGACGPSGSTRCGHYCGSNESSENSDISPGQSCRCRSLWRSTQV